MRGRFESEKSPMLQSDPWSDSDKTKSVWAPVQKKDQFFFEIRHLGVFIIQVFTPVFVLPVCVTFKLELLHVTIYTVMST